MPTKKHPLAGGKYTRSHSTATETVRKICAIAEKHPSVTKISIGIIRKSARGGAASVKIQTQKGGLFLRITGNGATQEVRLYTNDVDGVGTKLHTACERVGIAVKAPREVPE
jgi:carbon monoxide dehydrogenase subunit G